MTRFAGHAAHMDAMRYSKKCSSEKLKQGDKMGKPNVGQKNILKRISETGDVRLRHVTSILRLAFVKSVKNLRDP
jgi:hypothetical protein